MKGRVEGGGGERRSQTDPHPEKPTLKKPSLFS